MAKRPVERINFAGDDDTTANIKRLQDSVIRAVNPITALPILDGLIIGPITLGTLFAPVNHTLGRQYLGWFVTRSNALATVCEDFTATNQNVTISMKASAAATVYLWVF